MNGDQTQQVSQHSHMRSSAGESMVPRTRRRRGVGRVAAILWWQLWWLRWWAIAARGGWLIGWPYGFGLPPGWAALGSCWDIVASAKGSLTAQTSHEIRLRHYECNAVSESQSIPSVRVLSGFRFPRARRLPAHTGKPATVRDLSPTCGWRGRSQTKAQVVSSTTSRSLEVDFTLRRVDEFAGLEPSQRDWVTG